MKPQTKFIYLFLAPALLLLTLFVVGPMLFTFAMSLMKWEGTKIVGFAGLDNYLEVFGRREIFYPKGFERGRPPFGALVHNAIWILIHVPLSTVLGLLLAVMLRDVKGAAVIKSVIFLGMVTPMVIGGVLLRFVYDKNAGIFNEFLRIVGLGHLARTWTAYPDTALYALILGSVWIWTGFSMIVYSAGLETIPQELIEAARVDGASELTIFRYIIVPLLKPATIVVVTMSVLWVLKIFDIVYVATLGGPGGASTVLALEMYMDAFFKIPPNYGTAAAIASILTILTLGLAIYAARYMVVR